MADRGTLSLERVRAVGGLSTTFQLLAQTANEAAVRVLVPALDSADGRIRAEAVRALLLRRSNAGGTEILRRLDELDDACREVARARPGRLGGALRDALLGSDPEMCQKAAQAVVWFREYDLVPALLSLVEGGEPARVELACRTILQLCRALCQALADQGDPADRRDPHLIRNHILTSLENSVRHFSRHKRREVIEAFLLLADRDNATLMSILNDTHSAIFLALVDVLSHSERSGVMRLLLGYLDDQNAPSMALSVAANRKDLKFLRLILRKMRREPSAAARHNLKRIKSLSWVSGDLDLLAELDEPAQYGAVRLVMHAGIPRVQAFAAVAYLLQYGRPAARREAARALGAFHGNEANNLALRALDDLDPQVQANVIPHLRQRGIPGILGRLVACLDSRHAVVRRAARASLSEFRFERFLGTFDTLDDDVRRTTGALVRKVDTHSVRLLEEQMRSAIRARRARALEMARAMGLVERLAESIIALLRDEDHLVRVEAAYALGECPTPQSRRALEAALGDRSPAVQEAAAKALDQHAEYRGRHHDLADSRD